MWGPHNALLPFYLQILTHLLSVFVAIEISEEKYNDVVQFSKLTAYVYCNWQRYKGKVAAFPMGSWEKQIHG